MKKSVGKSFLIEDTCSISLKFSWDCYKKQHSAGLIGGLLEKAASAVDCDASAFLIEEKNGKKEVSGCVCYEQLTSEDGAVVHTGDNTTQGPKDMDEEINVDLGKVPSSVKAIVFTLDMLKEKRKHLMLGKLDQVKADISNSKTGDILGDYNIIGIGDKAIQVGMLVRQNEGWMYEPEVLELKHVNDRAGLVSSIIF